MLIRYKILPKIKITSIIVKRRLVQEALFTLMGTIMHLLNEIQCYNSIYFFCDYWYSINKMLFFRVALAIIFKAFINSFLNIFKRYSS